MNLPAASTAASSERRTEILRRAAEIFCAKGFHAASMGEIADAVALTKAGLYYHVDGKEELLFEIVSYGMDRLEGWIAAAREESDPVERLRRIVHAHAAGITRDGSAITLLVDEVAGLRADHGERIRRRQRTYFEFVRETLIELESRGRLADVDPTVAAFGLIGSIMWLARWFRPGGRLTGEEVAEAISRQTLSGILKERPQ